MFFLNYFGKNGTHGIGSSSLSKDLTSDLSHVIKKVSDLVFVWLDSIIDEPNNDDKQQTLIELRKITDNIHSFTNSNQCIAFIRKQKISQVVLIMSGRLGQTIVPIVHHMPQFKSIHIFCRNESKYSEWAQSWPIVKGVYTDIIHICQLYNRTARQDHKEMNSISFVANPQHVTNENVDQIDQSFMYTLILKEILLTIEFNKQTMKDFLLHFREQFSSNLVELKNIDRLEHEYRRHTPIWWYTKESFLYSTLNRALRLIEIDTIIKMGFFLRDVHNQISELHSKKYGHGKNRHIFTVYRGQSLSRVEFDRMLIAQGGLISFNNFLSTSKALDVSLQYARNALTKSDGVSILFVMQINPLLTSTPFASVQNMSCYRKENEIIFSMNSIFRIGSIEQIEPNNDRLWRVELTLTEDTDPQRRRLTERMRQQTLGVTQWDRLGRLLIIIGEYCKAEDLYKILLNQSKDEYEKAHYNHHLAAVKEAQGDYTMAIDFYHRSLEINAKLLSLYHPNLASSYTGLGLVYSKINDHKNALVSYDKALVNFQHSLASNDSRLAILYGNIGRLHNQMGDYSQALLSHEKAKKIFLATLPSHDPHIATCYADIGHVHRKMHNLDKALSAYQKALDIREHVLHPNHPLLAASCHNLGQTVADMGNHAQGLELIQRAIDIGRYSKSMAPCDLELYQQSLLSCMNLVSRNNCQ
jgi:tetratricopeptide (TPR) repeat protein